MGLERNRAWHRAFYLSLAFILVIYAFTHTFHGNRDTGIRELFRPSGDRRPSELAPKSGQRIPVDLHNEIKSDLTSEQCDAIFPDLYFEVDRAVAYWQDRGHIIDADDLDVSWRMKQLQWPRQGGAVRFLIHDNELRITDSELIFKHAGYKSRAIGFLALLNQAVLDATAAGEMLPTIEAAVMFEDIPTQPTSEGTHTFWTWQANITDAAHDRHWLVPNFDFYSAGSIGSYRQVRRRAMLQDSPWTSKIPKVIWRGTVWYNQMIRGRLVEITKDKPWADILPLDWQTRDTYMTVDEMCSYAMTMHTESGSYSGRLKHLLNCDSLPILHQLEWRTYFYHLLEPSGPNQNCVVVKRDFSDLEDLVEYYLANPAEAEIVVQNSLATFRNKYLTPAAQSCYIRKLIKGYSSVSDTPAVFRPLSKASKFPMRRGKAFEEWLLGEDYAEDEIEL